MLFDNESTMKFTIYNYIYEYYDPLVCLTNVASTHWLHNKAKGIYS